MSKCWSETKKETIINILVKTSFHKSNVCVRLVVVFGNANVKLDKHIFCIYIKAQQDKQEEEQDDWLKTRKTLFHSESICLQTNLSSTNTFSSLFDTNKHLKKKHNVYAVSAFLKMYLGSWHEIHSESWHVLLYSI